MIPLNSIEHFESIAFLHITSYENKIFLGYKDKILKQDVLIQLNDKDFPIITIIPSPMMTRTLNLTTMAFRKIFESKIETDKKSLFVKVNPYRFSYSKINSSIAIVSSKLIMFMEFSLKDSNEVFSEVLKMELIKGKLSFQEIWSFVKKLIEIEARINPNCLFVLNHFN